MNESDYILLYYPEDKLKNVTVSKYKEWEKLKNKNEITCFIYNRLFGRYIKPIDKDKLEINANIF